VAFVSVFAIQGEEASGQLRRVPIRGLWIGRHFHLIHHARRQPSAAARALVEVFATATPARPGRRTGRRG
jgi:DNA-binding transcriptional LysR family regulator